MNSLQQLKSLFRKHTGEEVAQVMILHTGSGSGRIYYRMRSNAASLIGVAGAHVTENDAFIYLTRHFTGHGLPVPELFGVSDDRRCYLLEDLGDQSLFSLLDGCRDDALREERLAKAIEHLVDFQVKGASGLDFDKCYPPHPFDVQGAMWDLNYFKYMFLKPAGVDVDDYQLEREFEALLDHLFDEVYAGFMYRDFQSRNIMVRHNRQWYIDYQGGRRGPLFYDVASLLYQSRLSLPQQTRDNMAQHYGQVLNDLFPVSLDQTVQQVHDFALLRLLQNLGAYGFRGLYERKEAFVKPIVPALANTRQVLKGMGERLKLPYLSGVLDDLTQRFQPMEEAAGTLRVAINSFSYMYGLPADHTGNGGGFVFDCRALPNPHHDPVLRPFTGRDEVIRQWLGAQEEVQQFLAQCEILVLQAVKKYTERGFNHLQVNFGCTGGKHRSVYCAEQLTERLNNHPHSLVTVVHHTRLELQ